ncbi:MAG: TetR/AcrR family transcriptional regulator [Microthrixaceae bacterium]|nr:TetR/AcrR family transcriptional regulator [Microthrixaceae bacterium]
MRTHGWRGEPPDSDDEARARIIEATTRCVERFGAVKLTLTDVAAEVGVTRQTIYRYFGGADELLVAAAIDSAQPFLEGLREHCVGIQDPTDLVVETIAWAVEHLPQQQVLWMWLTSGRSDLFSRAMTNGTAVAFARGLVENSSVDWSTIGYSDRDVDELMEVMLRTLRSLALDPGDPPRDAQQLRAFLRRWIGIAVVPQDRERNP